MSEARESNVPICPICKVERADWEDEGSHLHTCPNCGTEADPVLVNAEFMARKPWCEVPSNGYELRNYIENLLAPGEVARILSFSGTWIKELCKRGELHGYETTLGYLIEPQSVIRYLDNRLELEQRKVAALQPHQAKPEEGEG